MDLQEKIERHNYLERMNFRSDQEEDELMELKKEIRSGLDALKNKVIPEEIPVKKQPESKKYRGIISGRILKWRDERREKNKATPEKIAQLKLEVQKASLERKLAEEKEKKNKAKWEKINKMFSSGGKTDREIDGDRDKLWKKYQNWKW